jgi:predicted alternative tryptophan synthase beta-subunit
MKNLKTFILLIGIGCSALFAPPIYAGGCKFHGTTALSCEDGKGGYVNTFFNGENNELFDNNFVFTSDELDIKIPKIL